MNYALILMGGIGKRFGNELPKQFVQILGKPIYFHPLSTFQNSEVIDEIVVVCCQEYIEKVKTEIANFGFNKVTKIVKGGRTRQESVFNGLKALECAENDIVFIHDSARALIDEDTILSLVANLSPNVGVAPYILKEESLVSNFHDREIGNLLVQTPQAFFYKDIMCAHEKFAHQDSFVDDLSILVANGGEQKLIKGKNKNFKLTEPEDLSLLRKFIF